MAQTLIKASGEPATGFPRAQQRQMSKSDVR
jgi:hypothetical protein